MRCPTNVLAFPRSNLASALNDHLGHGKFCCMSDGEYDVTASEAMVDFEGLAREPQARFSAGGIEYLEVSPSYASPPPCPEGLHARFFRREARGKAFSAILVALAVCNLRGSEYAIQKAVPVPLNGCLHAWNFGNVDSHSYNHAAAILTQACAKVYHLT